MLFQPFLASRKPSRQTVLILITLSWTISLFLALLPFTTSLQYIFAERALIPDNVFFRNVTVNFDAAKNWAEKLLTFSPEMQLCSEDVVHQIRDAVSWADLQSAIANASMADTLNIRGFIG